jgi:alpha-tubulin suppressor-like RCC1 family protein
MRRAQVRADRGALTLSFLLATACSGGPGGGPQGAAAGNAGAGARPSPGSAPSQESPPATDGAARPLQALAVSYHRICAILGGSVHCGGGSIEGEGKPLAAEPRIEGIEDAVSLALGDYLSVSYGCAVSRPGTVRCFGSNVDGQLGAMLRAEKSDQPVVVAGITSAARVVTGRGHACAILTDGSLWCWGSNMAGETGGPVSYERAARELIAPTPVPITNVVSAAATIFGTCAVTRERETFCWGTSLLDEQKIARGRVSEQPLRVGALSGLVDITADEGDFCGLRDSGEVICWDESGMQAPAASGVKRVRVAQAHACGLGVDDRVFCWGSNRSGALGRRDEDPPDRSDGSPLPPAPVKGLPSSIRAVDVVVGGSMSCAVMADAAVYCWGTWPYVEGKGSKERLTPMKLRIHG